MLILLKILLPLIGLCSAFGSTLDTLLDGYIEYFDNSFKDIQLTLSEGDYRSASGILESIRGEKIGKDGEIIESNQSYINWIIIIDY